MHAVDAAKRDAIIQMYACDAAVENNDHVKMHFDCKLKSVMGTLILRYDIKIPYGW